MKKALQVLSVLLVLIIAQVLISAPPETGSAEMFWVFNDKG